MGSAIENSAANIAAPKMGNIRVLAVTTSASAIQNVTEFLAGASTGYKPRWITFICDVAWYVTCGSTSTITDPDSTATTTDARTWRVPADQPFAVRVTKDTAYFKARGSAAGTLRWYPSDNVVQ